jgi:uncharacterized SAM-binding protein YcdF (DUF218 family)
VADFVRFVFSIGGMTCALLAGLLWSLARRSSRAPAWFITAVVLFFAAVSIYPLAHVLAARLARPYHPLSASDVPPGRNIVVILGSGSFTAHDWYDQYTVSLSDPTGADRVLEGFRVFNLIHPDLIISSGGAVGSMDRLGPGGKVMKDLLVQLGVPEPRILVETESQNTHDEAVIVKRMLEPLHADHVILVTSDVHMARSVGTFRAAGIEVIPAIARAAHFAPPWNISFLPSSTGINEFQDVVHEAGGMAYYRLRGWYR